MVGTSRGRPPQFLRRVHNRPALRRRGHFLALLRLAGVAGGLLVGGFAAFAVYGHAIDSHTFMLREVVLDEVPPSLIDAVEARVSPALGRNLLVLDLQALRRRIERLPRVQRARVRRLLPDRIEVVVEERLPWARLEATDGSYLIDKEGAILAADDGAARQLHRIRIAAAIAAAVKTSHRLPEGVAGADRLHDAVQILASLPASPATPLGRIEYARLDPEGVTLVTGGGLLEILLGDSSALEEKFLNLTALLQAAPPMGPCQVDLRFRDQVIVRDLAGG